MADLTVLETRSYEVIDEARHMMFSKLFAKANEVHFQERVDDLSERLKALMEFSCEEKQRFVNMIRSPLTFFI